MSRIFGALWIVGVFDEFIKLAGEMKSLVPRMPQNHKKTDSPRKLWQLS